MAKKPFEPNFKTPTEDLEKVEIIKKNSLFVNREIAVQFREDLVKDVSIDVEQYAKSYGIYLEFDRAKKGRQFDWSYMIRIANPGGGPISAKQWRLFDELSEKHCNNPEGPKSLRFTTRQAIQFHWINKAGILDIVKTLAENGLLSLNGCGDNTRNTLACPLSRFSDVFNANALSKEIGDYFQLPIEPYIKVFQIDPNTVRKPEKSFQYGPQLLNRKFKIAVSTFHKDLNTGTLVPDNCIEVRTNDLGVVPIHENGEISAYQIYIGGGQGERNNHPSGAMLGEPFCIVTKEMLLPTMDAIVQVHQEWGDRGNRFWARLKYVVKKKGVDWYRDQVSARLGSPLMKPNPDLDFGDRHLHHGWWKQPSNGLWTYGAFIENGRIQDGGPNGNLKTMFREVMEKYQGIELSVSANQDALFSNIEEAAKEDFMADLEKHGFGKRDGKPFSTLRKLSGACVGRNTCRLTYTDSEKLEPWLIDELEKLGWGDLNESIGITGCERQCFRPATKTVGLVGSGLDRYMVKLFGDETGRYQGRPLVSSNGNELYLRSVLKEQLPTFFNVIFSHYKENSENGESLGAFHRRLGDDAIIEMLKSNSDTAALMAKPFNTDSILD